MTIIKPKDKPFVPSYQIEEPTHILPDGKRNAGLTRIWMDRQPFTSAPYVCKKEKRTRV